MTMVWIFQDELCRSDEFWNTHLSISDKYRDEWSRFFIDHRETLPNISIDRFVVESIKKNIHFASCHFSRRENQFRRISLLRIDSWPTDRFFIKISCMFPSLHYPSLVFLLLEFSKNSLNRWQIHRDAFSLQSHGRNANIIEIISSFHFRFSLFLLLFLFFQ